MKDEQLLQAYNILFVFNQTYGQRKSVRILLRAQLT